MERRKDMLCVDLGNKKLIKTRCDICGTDIFSLKTKEKLCDECAK